MITRKIVAQRAKFGYEFNMREMGKGRLEAFSDGVFAIIITVMVLELKVPHAHDWEALRSLAFPILSYVLSFIYGAIYWNNHHHLFQLVKRVRAGVLWSNMHLLFWLSLMPLATAWMDESEFASLPVAAYGFVFLMAAIAYFILVRVLLTTHGPESELAKAIGSDFKGKISAVIYAVAIPLAFWWPVISCAAYVLVAFIWLVPDRRIEREFVGEHQGGE